jgi:hypothetical protein
MPLAVSMNKDLCSCLYFLLQEESDSIERLHISASEAFTKFKGKTLDGKGIDFSDRLSKRLRTGYDARYSHRASARKLDRSFSVSCCHFPLLAKMFKETQ